MTLIGFDNGSSGSLGIINTDTGDEYFYKTPVKLSQNYQSTKNTLITRIDINKLKDILLKHMHRFFNYAVIERPLNNPRLYVASLSAMRALEATIIVLEELMIPYKFIDSKQWQKIYLGSHIKGKDNLKAKSKELGQLKFPDIKNSDFDGYFISKYLQDNFKQLFGE